MGDCRIRLFLDPTETTTDDIATSTTTNILLLSNKLYSADSVIIDVCNTAVQTLLLSQQWSLWNITLHPAVCLNLVQPDGSWTHVATSRTLYDWQVFPSGRFVLMAAGRGAPTLFDFQQNSNLDTAATTTPTTKRLLELVRYTGNNRNKSSRPLPSQIMTAVRNRFDEQPAEQPKQAPATTILHKPQPKTQPKKSSKIAPPVGSATQNRVRRLWLLNHCTGNDNIPADRRLYLEFCGCLDDPIYRFVALDDSVGKVVDALVRQRQATSSFGAWIVPTSSVGDSINNNIHHDNGTPQRFPSSMILRQMQSAGLVTDGATVQLVVADALEDLPLSVWSSSAPTVGESTVAMPPQATASSLSQQQQQQDHSSSATTTTTTTLSSSQQVPYFVSTMTSTSTTIGKKEKVRQIKVATRAKGDVKRIPHKKDRFYVQVFYACSQQQQQQEEEEEEESTPESCGAVFGHAHDTVERLMRQHIVPLLSSQQQHASTTDSREIWIESTDTSGWTLLTAEQASSTRLQQALPNFGRLVIWDRSASSSS